MFFPSSLTEIIQLSEVIFLLNFDKGISEEAELITEKGVGCNCISDEELECLTDVDLQKMG